MFDQILKRLTNAEPQSAGPDNLQIAVAVLLVEAALMDGGFDAAERTAIETVLAKRFDLSADATKQLLSLAEKTAKQSAQLFPFTRATVNRMDSDERIRLIEMLWEVAYADGTLSQDEDSLIRRIAGLIYVSDVDRGAARQRVLQKLQRSK